MAPASNTTRQHRAGFFADRRRYAAFSLVEMLVAIAVIGILLAIALPAVQHARESARRTQCKNHLHQLAVAVQNRNSQFGHLPVDGTNGFGVGVFLLPHLGQAPLYETICPLATGYSEALKIHAATVTTTLPVFICPSDGSDAATRANGRSNYLGNGQLFSRHMSLAEVIDGESNTIAFGETTNGHTWAQPGTGSFDAPPGNSGTYSSRHTGGAQFAFCDGTVRFLSNGIDAETFRALGTPAGDEPIGPF